jgi:hypothetical protein
MSEQSLWADDDVVGAALQSRGTPHAGMKPAKSGRQRGFSAWSFAAGAIAGFVVGCVTVPTVFFLMLQATAGF